MGMQVPLQGGIKHEVPAFDELYTSNAQSFAQLEQMEPQGAARGLAKLWFDEVYLPDNAPNLPEGFDINATREQSFDAFWSDKGQDAPREIFADLYFKKYVETQPNYSLLDDAGRQQARLQFNQKYNVGRQSANWQELGNLFTLNTPARAWDAAHFGASDFAAQNDAALEKFMTDPGLYGHMARLSQNDFVRGAGSMLGGFGKTSGLVGQIQRTGAPQALAGTLGKKGVGKWLLGDPQRAAFTGGMGLYSGMSNAVSVGKGEQTPVAGAVNTAGDVLLGPLGGRTRLGNAMLQGGIGAVQGAGGQIVQDLSSGQPIDWKRTKQAAIQGGMLGAGVGSAFPEAKSLKGRVEHRAEVTTHTPPDVEPVEAPPASSGERLQAREIAIELHKQLTSDNPQTRIKAKEFKRQLEAQATDRRSRYNPAKILRQGDFVAKEILAELEIYRDSLKNRATFHDKPKVVQQGILNTGLRMRKSQAGKARFDAELSKLFTPEEKRLILGRIQDMETAQKKQAAIEKTRKLTRREQGIQRRNEINRKRQDSKRQRIKAENEKIKRQLEKQREEAKNAKAKAAEARKKANAEEKARKKRLAEIEAEQKKATAEKKKQLAEEQARLKAEQKKALEEKKREAQRQALPKVLDAEQIEKLSDELLVHYKAGEKGSLEAKLTKYRKAMRNDHARNNLVSGERSEAIRETHARVLDRYFQKKAEVDAQRKTPSKENVENARKARAENMKELEAIKEAGGDYNLKTGIGRERPIQGEMMSWEDVRDLLDPKSEAYHYAEAIGEAMRQDGDATIRIDSERSGDTGEFEYKRVSPKGFKFNYARDAKGQVIDTRLVFRGVNKNGHTGEYYIEPSAPNPKTGTISGILEQPIVHQDSFGKAKRNGEPNVYFGQRDFKVKDVLTRPLRKTEGLTSELQLKAQKARQLLDDLEHNRIPGSEKRSVEARAIKDAVRQSEGLRKLATQETLNKSDVQKLVDELDALDTDTRKSIDKGLDC